MQTVKKSLGQLLAELEMMSHGTITNWSPTTHTPADSREPTGEPNPPHEVYRRRYEQCAGDSCRRRVEEEAEAELNAWRVRGQQAPVEGETAAQLNARLLTEGRGWSPKDVALKFNCTPKYVERVRREAGVATDTGERPEGQEHTGQEARIRELIDRGLSERQVRMFTGCGGSKIARAKGRV